MKHDDSIRNMNSLSLSLQTAQACPDLCEHLHYANSGYSCLFLCLEMLSDATNLKYYRIL